MPDNIYIYILGVLFLILFILILVVRSKTNQAENDISHIKSEQKSISDIISASEIINDKIKTRIEEVENAQMQADIDIRKLDESLSNYHQRVVHNINELYKQDVSHTDTIHHLENEINSLRNELNCQASEIQALSSLLKEQTAKLAEFERASHIISTITESSEGLNDPIEVIPEAYVPGLNKEKQKIFDEIISSHANFFITGKAGTGKSYLLKHLFEYAPGVILRTAPTGIAALNINGITIHRAFGYENLKLDAVIELSSYKADVLKHASIIVIDEISMVSSEVFEQINLVLQYVCENELPFGGKQIVLFGDVFQLPPVIKHSDLRAELNRRYGGVYFFNAPSFVKGNFQSRILQEQFRVTKGEKKEEYLQALDRIRTGTFTDPDLNLFNKHIGIPFNEQITMLVSTKEQAAKINKNELNRLILSTEYTYDSKIRINENTYLGKTDIKNIEFPVTERLILRKGALVMMVSNDLKERWVNGSIGIVDELTETKIRVSFGKNKTYDIEKETFSYEICIYDKSSDKLNYVTLASLTQYPIILAYAITIHKAQGMTYPKIACDTSACFDNGQAYVALSRCSNFDKLYLISPLKREQIKTSQNMVDFYHSIE